MKFTEELWKTIEAFFVAMFKNVWAGFRDMVLPVVNDVNKGILDFLGSIEDDQWYHMARYFKEVGLLSPEAEQEIQKLKDFAHPFDWIFYIMTFQGLTQSYLQENLTASAGDFRKALYSKYTPGLPSSGEVMKAAFIAPEVTERVRDIMKQNGISDDDIDLMFLANYRLYDEMTIRDLFLRKVLDADQVFMRMRELGYTDTRTKEIVQSWKVIPGIADIMHMVAKEAFEPEMYEEMGLNQEFPEEQTDWFEKQGLSRFWQEKYWIAHWEQPSLQMGFEMLHRGIINEKQLDMIYKAVEIPPYWRPKLTAMAYNVYTRVDLRRMHKLGVVGDEDLVKGYMEQGYDREHAEHMALFTIRYNQESEIDINKSEILKAYKKRAIDRSSASDLLESIHLSEELISYYLDFADYELAQEAETDIINNIGELYTNRLIERTEANTKLVTLNLPYTQVKTLLEKWDIKIIKNTKIPSKTDLDKFLKAKIIDQLTYEQEMDKLGYSVKYTSWYYQLATGKKVKG